MALILLGLPIASAATPDTLAPGPYIIEKIEIKGHQTLEPPTLLSMITCQAGDIVQIPGLAISHMIRKLWQQKCIADVTVYASQITERSIALTIEIQECPRLADYSFVGLSNEEVETLQEKLQLVRGAILTERLLKHNQDKIQTYLMGQGYLEATLQIQSMPDPELANHKQLTIHVDKGKRFTVGTLTFEGNVGIDADRLKGQFLYIKEKPRFTLIQDVLRQLTLLKPFRKGGLLWQLPSLEAARSYLRKHVIFLPSKFVASKYATDKESLIQYYQQQGYRDAVILEDRLDKQATGEINITLKLSEGQPYYIRHIYWQGNALYTSQKLGEILSIVPGDVYNTARLQQKLFMDPAGHDVASLYVDDGYLFFNAEPVEVAVVDNSVDIAIRIQEGIQAYINKVTITGNAWTHEDVIRRELRTLPGDKFSRQQLFRSQRQLAMLNIFDPAQLKVTPTPSPSGDTVDLHYEVKESPKFDFKGGIGFGGESAHVSLSLGVNNFSLGNLLKGQVPLGAAQTVSLQAEMHRNSYMNFSFQFVEPWLGGRKPTTALLALHKAYQHSTSNGSTHTMGARMGLGTRLTWPDDYTSVRGDIGLERQHYQAYDLLDNQEKLTGVIYELSLQTSLERNSTDHPIYPTRGSEIGLQLKLTPPYSWVFSQARSTLSKSARYTWKDYHQWMANAAYFQRLFRDLVAYMRLGGGILGGYGDGYGVGPFERFGMGGIHAVDYSLLGRVMVPLRGYPEEYVLPRDPGTGYVGGTLFNKVTLELRYPLVKSLATYIYGFGFAEAGNTWLNYHDWRLLDLKRTVGLGLRLQIPVGTIGLDWGYGFDKPQGDKLEFHWSLGGGAS
ncbi:MAG: POTRA domain-containing protein [Bacteroidota bacterium]